VLKLLDQAQPFARSNKNALGSGGGYPKVPGEAVLTVIVVIRGLEAAAIWL